MLNDRSYPQLTKTCPTFKINIIIVISRDGVSPAEAAAASLPASPSATTLVKKKAGGANEVRERAAAVRTRRLMKELKEIQRIQNSRPDPVFTVRYLVLCPTNIIIFLAERFIPLFK